MANFNTELVMLRESLNKLTKDFETQGQMAKTFQDTFYRLGEMILELEEHFKQITDPLMKIITTDKSEKEPSSSTDLVTRTVSINNLNEFICESVIAEYLRQNNVFVIKCSQTLGYNERSRNFLVVVRQADLEKLLQPDIWPKGVTLAVRGDYKVASVHGKREKNLPGVVISSGMSYWHS